MPLLAVGVDFYPVGILGNKTGLCGIFSDFTVRGLVLNRSRGSAETDLARILRRWRRTKRGRPDLGFFSVDIGCK